MTDDLIVKLSKTQDEFIYSDAVVNLIYSSKGEGKCLKSLEKVIMYDGTIKFAKDICVGDLLMGDDSSPRTVLSLIEGEGPMYEVVSRTGDNFGCNGDHILVLYNHYERRDLLVTVNDYLKNGLGSRGYCLYRFIDKFSYEVVEIETIKSVGIGKYSGFMLDGNHKFLLANKIVSHNSFASIIALIYHAKRCGKPIRGAIVRDSHENIKISTVRSIQDALPLGYYKFKNDFKHLDIFSDPPVALDLFGIDDLSSVSKLQGPEYAIIWLEEPAPIADAANAGLAEDVYNAALASCARQKGTVPRLQISMNPGNEEHWTFRRFFTDPILSSDGDHMIDPDNPLITIRVFRVPVGENKELSEIARQATQSAYSNDPQSYARYAKGEFAKVYTGKKVTPDYNKNGQHYSDVILSPANGLVGFMAFDSWHSPSACLGQITRTGRLIFIDTLRLLDSDIRTLIKAQISPLINSPRWKDKCSAWRTVGDCSMKIPDQSNKNESASRVVEDAFGTIFEPGPKLWEHLKSGMTRALNENIKGLPAIVINKTNRLLHDALSGSWHYKTDKAGNLLNNIPHKTESSHVGDSFANACSVLLPEIGQKMDKSKWNAIAKKLKNRANSY